MLEEERVNPIFLEKEKLKELALKLRTIPETSGALRRTLSTDNVQKFMQIMTSSEITDLDILCLSGEMSAKEAEQYLWASGDYSKCAHNLTELALKMAREFKEKLQTLVRNELRGQRNEGIYNLFNAITDLFLVRAKQLENLRVFGTQLGESFIFQVLALVGSDLIDLMDDPRIDIRQKSKIKNVIDDLNAHYLEKEGCAFVGIQLYSEKTAYKRICDNPVNRAMLDGVIGFSGEYDSEDRLAIERENYGNLAFIKREAVYKKIPLVTVNPENPQIILMRGGGSDVMDESLMLEILMPDIRINFCSEKKIGFPKLEKRMGRNQYDYEIREGVLNLRIDPETGDLCFITGGIPIHQIISRDRYLALQKYLLHSLKIFLEGKYPDIDDLFVYSPVDMSGKQTEVLVSERSKEKDDFSVAREEEDREYISHTQENSLLDAREKEAPLVLPKHYRTAIMDRINGARAEDILHALRRMLGGEVRTEGSHYFFRSKRNDVILPVPKHSRGSRHHISPSLIINNLRAWGYRPLELAIELGANIPKKYHSEE